MAIVATEQPTDLARSASPACTVPDGVAHALDPDASRTWCGVDAAWLTPWPELAWPPSGMAATDTCPACERGVVEALRGHSGPVVTGCGTPNTESDCHTP